MSSKIAVQTEAARAKAGRFAKTVKARGLDKEGWSGSFWEEGESAGEAPAGSAVLECVREATDRTVEETILQLWEGNTWVKGVYKAYGRERPIKNAADALRMMAGPPAPLQSDTDKKKGKKPKLGGYKHQPPSYDGMTDQEVMDTLYGKTITFRRGLDGVEETVTIPPRYHEEEDSRGKVRLVENDISTHRIINFIGGRPGEKQFRAVNINNIVSLG